MLGSGLQLGRCRGEDRFYKARRHYQNQNNDQLRRARSDGAANRSTSVGENKFVSSRRSQPDSRRVPEEPAKPPVAAPNPDPVVSPPQLSNLELFLDAIRPSVPAQYLSKTTVRGWRTCDVDIQPYFVLGDLWESFKERSAYGAGVPLILNESDSVVQYYVPYLSGVQIYGESMKSSVKSRQLGEDSDVDSLRDSSSDGCSDCEPEGVLRCSKEHSNPNHLTIETTLRMDRMSLRDQHTAFQEELSSDESESGNAKGCLLFEYFERDPPYSREPLANKISDLVRHFPDLMTLRSCDLLSSSWISVAWYPIYRIPTGPTLRDLDACFLTFHYLYTPIRGAQDGRAPVIMCPNEVDGVPKISLPVFGLASYKFKGSLWTRNGGCEHQVGSSLFRAADSWLRQHQVSHPDFLFFSRR